ncbi:hypothetical protein [Sphingobacterium hungaricum]|nr:hypothetical protein [Sphingobacterium hungaricum]
MKLHVLFAIIILMAVQTMSFAQQKLTYTNQVSFGSSYGKGSYSGSLNNPNGTINFVNLNFEYVGSLKFDEKFSIGLGTGIKHFVEFSNDYRTDVESPNPQYLFVPAFLQAQYRFSDTKVSPFASTSIGYLFSLGEWEHEYTLNSMNYSNSSKLDNTGFANLHVGASMRINNKLNVFGGPYLEYLRTRNTYKSAGATDITELNIDDLQNEPISMWMRTDEYTINLMQFGLKVGLIF